VFNFVSLRGTEDYFQSLLFKKMKIFEIPFPLQIWEGISNIERKANMKFVKKNVFVCKNCL